MITKKENIVEHILLLWQAEDYVRAMGDSEDVRTNRFLSEIRDMLYGEGIIVKGHTQVSLVALSELEQLHSELYATDATYKAAWLALLPQITAFKAKTDEPAMSDMKACLTFLYDIMLLRLRKQSISGATLTTQQQVSSLMRTLALAYREKQTI